MKYAIEISDETDDFLKSIPKTAFNKFIRAFEKVSQGLVREDYFKKLTDKNNLWEFRVMDDKKWLRILAFMCKYDGDDYTTIVAIHGFQKKGNKTPENEIEKAENFKKRHIK